MAGLDTTSTLLSFASHQLAVYPEIQSRLQEEIDETLQEHAGKFTYEAVNSMKYLGMVVSGKQASIQLVVYCDATSCSLVDMYSANIYEKPPIISTFSPKTAKR